MAESKTVLVCQLQSFSILGDVFPQTDCMVRWGRYCTASWPPFQGRYIHVSISLQYYYFCGVLMLVWCSAVSYSTNICAIVSQPIASRRFAKGFPGKKWNLRSYITRSSLTSSLHTNTSSPCCRCHRPFAGTGKSHSKLGLGFLSNHMEISAHCTVSNYILSSSRTTRRIGNPWWLLSPSQKN